MNNSRKIIYGYLIILTVLFLTSYFLLGVRESRLYLFLMAVNLPASLIIVPGMEEVAVALGWVLGGPAHVWATQIACMAVNGGFYVGMVRIARRIKRTDV